MSVVWLQLTIWYFHYQFISLSLNHLVYEKAITCWWCLYAFYFIIPTVYKSKEFDLKWYMIYIKKNSKYSHLKIQWELPGFKKIFTSTSNEFKSHQLTELIFKLMLIYNPDHPAASTSTHILLVFFPIRQILYIKL